MKPIWLKLALVFMLVGAGGILISTILSIEEMDYHFSMYLDDVHGVHHDQLAAMLQEAHQRENGWGTGAIQIVETASQVLGVRITLYDRDRRTIAKVGKGQVTESGPTKPEELRGITVEGTVIGYLDIQYTDQANGVTLEEHFQMAHTNAMQGTMLALLLLVCVVSVVTARRLVRPIDQMRQAALDVAGGDLSVRVPVPRGKDELTELVDTFNHLIVTLQKQDELRKRLTADIAHELRTPLNTLLAQTEGMLDGVWEATPEHLEATRAEVLRLIRLVSDLDQVMQAEAGSMLLSREAVDLSQVAEMIVDSMAAAFQREGIALTSRLKPSAWMIGDQQRLMQVFANLLTNSLKHTPEGGTVTVSVQKRGTVVEARVTDNGSGIAPEDLPFVFERFYRGDRSRNREGGGAGLGLTIVKGIVDAHQGEIQIASEPGKGTTVTVRFPGVPEGS